jgi:hypothetical protein
MIDLLDEFTNGPLADELAPLIQSADYDGILAILNRKDITVYGNLSVHNVKRYVSLIGLRLPILDSTQLSCREFNLALEDFKDSGFDLSNPYILAKITAVLDALVAENLIPDFTEEHKLALLSFGNKLISRVEQLGINPTRQDIATTIFADDGTRKI